MKLWDKAYEEPTEMGCGLIILAVVLFLMVIVGGFLTYGTDYQWKDEPNGTCVQTRTNHIYGIDISHDRFVAVCPH